MQHPDIMRFLVDERIDTLRRDARRVPRPTRVSPAADLSGIELRLCRVGDDPELERLAELGSQPVPVGRLVIAAVDGRIVAALPLGSGCMLSDPFVRTAHIRRLLEVGAAQLAEPAPRRGLVPRSVHLLRRA